MKKLTIGTKRQANAVITASLFKPINGRTLSVERYDLGKYKADSAFAGREIEVADRVHALWMERKKDSNGPYQALYCASEPHQ